MTGVQKSSSSTLQLSTHCTTPHLQLLPTHQSLAATTLLSVIWNPLLWGPHLSGITQGLSFCDWPVSLGSASSRLIRVQQVLDFPSLFRLNQIPLYGWTTLCSSIHLSMDTWTVSTFSYCEWCHRQISLGDLTFNSFGCVPRNTLAGSDGGSRLNDLRNCHAAFHTTVRCCVPTNSVRGSQFLHTLASTCFLFCFCVLFK